jgi:Transcriptional regulators of sugar metabolism
VDKKTQRMDKIIEILATKNGASTRELASLLGVSEMTIRRDVIVLSENNIVTNLYGAVIINPSSEKETYQLDSALTSNYSEKEQLGKFAASLISPNDIIIFDTGSTTEAVAKYIPDDMPLTILCYNNNILNHLLTKPNIKLIFSGGFYHPNTQMFESKEGRTLIQSTRATKVFVSAAGVHEAMGVTCANGYEIETKRAILQSGFEKILVVDSSKFSVIQSAYFAELSQFQTIITDDKITQEWISIIENLGVTLHIVKEDSSLVTN